MSASKRYEEGAQHQVGTGDVTLEHMNESSASLQNAISKNSSIRRIVVPTKSSRRLMRQISALGMEDPVAHRSLLKDNKATAKNIFDDMTLGDLPQDMIDMISIASDRTADDGEGLDMTVYQAFLSDLNNNSTSLFSQMEMSLPGATPISETSFSESNDELNNVNDLGKLSRHSQRSATYQRTPSKTHLYPASPSKSSRVFGSTKSVRGRRDSANTNTTSPTESNDSAVEVESLTLEEAMISESMHRKSHLGRVTTTSNRTLPQNSVQSSSIRSGNVHGDIISRYTKADHNELIGKDNTDTLMMDVALCLEKEGIPDKRVLNSAFYSSADSTPLSKAGSSTDLGGAALKSSSHHKSTSRGRPPAKATEPRKANQHQEIQPNFGATTERAVPSLASIFPMDQIREEEKPVESGRSRRERSREPRRNHRSLSPVKSSRNPSLPPQHRPNFTEKAESCLALMNSNSKAQASNSRPSGLSSSNHQKELHLSGFPRPTSAAPYRPPTPSGLPSKPASSMSMMMHSMHGEETVTEFSSSGYDTFACETADLTLSSLHSAHAPSIALDRVAGLPPHIPQEVKASSFRRSARGQPSAVPASNQVAHYPLPAPASTRRKKRNFLVRERMEC